jgi:hypothetical protein
MGAAAQFHGIGIPPHRQHADLIAVLLAEQRHGAGSDGVFGAHQPGGNRLVGADLGINLGLDGGDVVC